MRDQGDYDAAAKLFVEQLVLAERVKDDGGVALAAQGLGSVRLLQDRFPEALAYFERGATVSHAAGDRFTEAYCQVCSGQNPRPSECRSCSSSRVASRN